jgi:hypothetical protein
MTMIDHAIEDVAGRFGLGPKSGQLMQEVVRLITGSPGGVTGFIDKFRSAGLGSEVASWLGRTDGAVLAGPQVERALGSTILGGRQEARPWQRRCRNGYRLYPPETDWPNYPRRRHSDGDSRGALWPSPDDRSKLRRAASSR